MSTNDNYRNQNILYEIPDSEKGSGFLDFGFLIRDDTSCLKGSQSNAQDAEELLQDMANGRGKSYEYWFNHTK